MEIDLCIRPRLNWWLEFHSLEIQGRGYILVRDSRGIAEGPLCFPAELSPVVSRFDGTMSLLQIADACAAEGVAFDVVMKVTEELDRLYMLDNERTLSRWESLKIEYRTLDVREPALVGKVYPEDAESLRDLIRSFSAQSGAKSYSKPLSRSVVGVMSPHIDYARGRKVYGATMSVLEQIKGVPDLIVLLGTAHQYSEHYFHLTPKPFFSPLGLFPVDAELVQNIARNYGEHRCLGDEILHKREHSLELQIPLLAQRFSGQPTPMLLPILVNSFDQFLKVPAEPAVDSEIAEFLDIVSWLLQTLAREGSKILFYAGVDLAHIGPMFGDLAEGEPLLEGQLFALQEQDNVLLQSICGLDEQGLFFHLAADENKRRVCGFSSLYLMLSLMKRMIPEARGTVVDYQQVLDDGGCNVVSFASAAWTR